MTTETTQPKKRGPGRPRGSTKKAAKQTAPKRKQPTPDAEENSTTRERRPKRVPIAESGDVLTLKNAPKGFVYRWVQDKGDRLLRFYDAGYVHVHDKGGKFEIGDRNVEPDRQLGSVVSKITGKDAHTDKQRVDYLMAIREDWYEEDQKAKEQKIKESMETEFEQTKEALEDDMGIGGEKTGAHGPGFNLSVV